MQWFFNAYSHPTCIFEFLPCIIKVIQTNLFLYNVKFQAHVSPFYFVPGVCYIRFYLVSLYYKGHT